MNHWELALAVIALAMAVVVITRSSQEIAKLHQMIEEADPVVCAAVFRKAAESSGQPDLIRLVKEQDDSMVLLLGRPVKEENVRIRLVIESFEDIADAVHTLSLNDTDVRDTLLFLRCLLEL